MSGAKLADLSQIPEWRSVMNDGGSDVQSALFVPLKSPDRRAVFVCFDETRPAYCRNQLDLLVYLAPLVAQALQRSREMHRLDSLIDRLEDLAHHDTLTGLANRTVFTEKLQEAVAKYYDSGMAMAVLHIDLDDFKIVNDTLGHGTGDELIKAVGARLVESTRATDVVARLGGDEFAVLLTHLNQVSHAELVAEKILAVLAEPIIIEGTSIRPQASIGISVCPRDERQPEGILGSADIALYDAKSAGGGQASTFNAEMRTNRDNDLRLDAELRLGLERGELLVHYQPILSSSSHEVVAFEALVRWQHPSRGLLAPGVFLPVALRNNLIVEIGEFVLEQALADLAPWLRADPRRRVAVNLAAKQLQVPGFCETIERLLDAHDLLPSSLELELNEEMVVPRNADHMMATLEQLDQLKVGLAFDDFGSGYSSIAQLRRLPGHRLKIDRGFVGQLSENQADLAVVRGMIDLARGLGMTVVAEGVEEVSQQQVLESLGCHELQGFHFGRPAPIEELDLDGCCGELEVQEWTELFEELSGHA